MKIISFIILIYPLWVTAQSLPGTKSSKLNGHHLQDKKSKRTYGDDEARLEELIKPFYNEIGSINNVIAKKNDTLNNSVDSSAKSKLQQDINDLFNTGENLETQLISVQLDFIKNNPSSFFSLDRLILLFKRNIEQALICDSIEFLFRKLDKNIQNSKTALQLKKLILNRQNSKIGSIAPYFVMKDFQNRQVSLADFRNQKYVLLDFWASWCVPCREDIPSLKNIYRKYRNQGFEIIAISKDDDLSLWRKAIKKDSANWIHVSAPFSLQKNDSLITNKYVVFGIPVKVLINKEGVIIGRWEGGGEKNIAELEKLLSQSIDK